MVKWLVWDHTLSHRLGEEQSSQFWVCHPLHPRLLGPCHLVSSSLKGRQLTTKDTGVTHPWRDTESLSLECCRWDVISSELKHQAAPKCTRSLLGSSVVLERHKFPRPQERTPIPRVQIKEKVAPILGVSVILYLKINVYLEDWPF